MDVLPSNIMFDIFSRIPIKCLARIRCVSKLWCEYIDDSYLGVIHDKRVVEEHTPIMFHTHPALPKLARTLCFHMIKSSGTSHTMEPNKVPDLEFVCKKPLSPTSDYVLNVRVKGSCNGLFYIREDDCKVVTNMVVVHPLRKDCYELPPFPLRRLSSSDLMRESCGLGFDASTNTFKMVCVLLKKHASPKNPDLVRKNLCTMVHVFGTNSWQEIPKVPLYPIDGDAVFANGCLHWLVGFTEKSDEDCGREVIWFDVTKEEFGLIPPPSKTTTLPPTGLKLSLYYDHLVDLNGQVGYVCNKTMEIWVLKHKEWVLHCRIHGFLINQWVNFLGCWNKDGDILFKANMDGRDQFFIYDLKTGGLHEANVVGRGGMFQTGIIMYPDNLFSIRGINNKNCHSIRKNLVLKKSCGKW